MYPWHLPGCEGPQERSPNRSNDIAVSTGAAASGRLTFVNLEEIAELNDFVRDLAGLTQLYVDAPLLASQEGYFVYTDKLLAWVNYEGRARSGKITTNPLLKPKHVAQPPLHCE